MLQAPLLAFVTAVCGQLALLVSLVDKNGRAQHRIARIWARGCLVRLVAAQSARARRTCASIRSPSTRRTTLPTWTRRSSLRRFPSSSASWQRKSSGVAIYRLVSAALRADAHRHGKSARHACEPGRGREGIARRHAAVCVSRGRPDRDGELQPFLSGAAYLAIRAQVPLVPIAISGGYDLLPIHTRHFYPSKLTLSVGEPIETKGMSVRQIDQLTAQLRDAIGSMLQSEAGGSRARMDEPALSN